ncbi:hypothetical protein LTR95_002658 [Oleoguttula sp. CCFEE 5521]
MLTKAQEHLGTFGLLERRIWKGSNGVTTYAFPFRPGNKASHNIDIRIKRAMAAAKVFAIPELLELILEETPDYSALNLLEDVNRTWKATAMRVGYRRGLRFREAFLKGFDYSRWHFAKSRAQSKESELGQEG